MNANRVDGWGALADPTRREIVSRLAERPRPVGELAAELPVSRSAVSQHLKILKDAGLVAERAEGTRRIYRVNPVALAALRDQLETYWQRSLTRYADLVALDEGPNDDVAPDPEENRGPRPRPPSTSRSSSPLRSTGPSRCSPSASATSSRPSTTC